MKASNMYCFLGLPGSCILDALSNAGLELDRAGLMRAGRALEKHGNRIGSPFPIATGSITRKNALGQFHLDGILTNPNSLWLNRGSKIRVHPLMLSERKDYFLETGVRIFERPRKASKSFEEARENLNSLSSCAGFCPAPQQGELSCLARVSDLFCEYDARFWLTIDCGFCCITYLGNRQKTQSIVGQKIASDEGK
jgi:hypothetical protein